MNREQHKSKAEEYLGHAESGLGSLEVRAHQARLALVHATLATIPEAKNTVGYL